MRKVAMPTIWLTSDTHYGHDNIIGYCARPYRTVAEMNYDMARRWLCFFNAEGTRVN
ncbi:MAG: hypothetical protein JWP44_4856 [Mucilaginibacter sp.]|nr:hypothetical protein [Mucilaginibacter sp.]